MVKSLLLLFCFLTMLASSACVVFLPLVESDYVPAEDKGIGAKAHYSSELRSKRNVYRKTEAQKFSALLKQLSANDDVARTHAASELGALGPRAQAAVPELRRALLQDPSKWVRRASAKALGNIGGTEAIKALELATSDRDKYVAQSAKNSLKKSRRSSL